MSVIWYTQANYSDLMVRDLKWLLLFTISHIDPWPYNISMIVQLISIKLDLFSLIIISIFWLEEYSKKVLCCWKEVVIRASRRKITPTPQKKEKGNLNVVLINFWQYPFKFPKYLYENLLWIITCAHELLWVKEASELHFFLSNCKRWVYKLY